MLVHSSDRVQTTFSDPHPVKVKDATAKDAINPKVLIFMMSFDRNKIYEFLIWKLDKISNRFLFKI
jgi:hypothetical protein